MSFRPTQTRLCEFGWVWSSLRNIEQDGFKNPLLVKLEKGKDVAVFWNAIAMDMIHVYFELVSLLYLQWLGSLGIFRPHSHSAPMESAKSATVTFMVVNWQRIVFPICDLFSRGWYYVSKTKDTFSNPKKGRQRQLLPSSLRPLDATSKVPFPLWQTEAQQHKRNKDVAPDVCLDL